jgi:hypothetical protein
MYLNPKQINEKKYCGLLKLKSDFISIEIKIPGSLRGCQKEPQTSEMDLGGSLYYTKVFEMTKNTLGVKEIRMRYFHVETYSVL